MTPVMFDIEYTEPRNRLSNGLRIFYALPHLIIVNALCYLAQVLSVIQWFIILFTGKRHQGMWNLSRGVLDWEMRANAYAGLMYDTYPNFGFEKRDEPVTFELTYEETANRLTCALRILWIIPAAIIFLLVAIGGVVVTLICWFAILFTGKQPKGMFDFLLKVYRMEARLNAYGQLLTDTYPKFE